MNLLRGAREKIFNRKLSDVALAYVPLIDRIEEYSKNKTKYEKGYFVSFLVAVLLSIVPFVMLVMHIKAPNEAFHFSAVSLSFILAYWGAGFLYFESNHRDETLARHVRNLTKGAAPKGLKRYKSYGIFLVFFAVCIIFPIYCRTTVFPVKFVGSVFLIYASIFVFIETETHSWYSIASSVETLLARKTRHDDNEAAAFFRDWYRKLGFRCLKWAALAGLIDLMKDAFHIAF